MIDEIISSVIESVGDMLSDSAGDAIDVLSETVDTESIAEAGESTPNEAPDILCNSIPDPSVYSGSSTKKTTEDQSDSQE